MTPIIIMLSLLFPSKQGRINSGTDLGTDLGTEVRFVVFIPDLPGLLKENTMLLRHKIITDQVGI